MIPYHKSFRDIEVLKRFTGCPGTVYKIGGKIVCISAVISMAFAFGHIRHQHHPYAFGYSVKGHYGEQHREESGIAGHSVKGSYGFKDGRGIHRHVHYVADHAGFRAEVKTNEPGTANQDPAAVKIYSSAHPHFGNHAGYGILGYGHSGFGGHDYGHGTGVASFAHGHGYGYEY